MPNTYTTSSGERVSKSTIDSRVREAKEQNLYNQMLEFGYNFCEKCHRSSGVRLDNAHIVSVDDCQKQGCSEKAYDVDNIQVLCRGCHEKQDKLNLIFEL